MANWQRRHNRSRREQEAALLTRAAVAMHVPWRFLPLDAQLEYRRRAMRDPNSYTLLGRMHKILFDREAMFENLPPLEEISDPTYLNLLQWNDQDSNLGFPLLAVSKNEQHLLLIGDVPHPQDRPDASILVPTDCAAWKEKGGVRPIEIPTRYGDRTRLRYTDSTGRRFLVLQPVAQIMLTMPGVDTFPMMDCSRPDGSGHHMAFLIDPATKEGHLIGGSFVIGTRVHQMPRGATP